MKDNLIILDNSIDDSSIRIWTCFADKDIKSILSKLSEIKVLNEDELNVVTGKQWNKMPFWQKFSDWIVPGANEDGTPKGWFEDRKFHTRVIRAEDLTSKNLLKALDDGFNVKVDYTGATEQQKSAASHLLSRAFDREFLKAHAQAAKDVSDVAAAVGGAVGYATGGAPGAAAGAAAAKGAVLNAEKDYVVDKFNDSVKGTEYEDLTITPADQHLSWFDQFIMFVCAHRYISIAAVIALVIIYKKRNWIWDRIKLGFSNLWQGKVIAKYQFTTVNNVKYSFEYDLRFNKWRLLYSSFKWTGDAFPPESAIQSFISTKHCSRFIKKCKKDMDFWFSHEDGIRKIANECKNDPRCKSAANMIFSVLDDRADIERSFIQLDYRIG